MSNVLAADDLQFGTGSRVVLRRQVYGHVAGAQGAVVRAALKGQAKVLVRFDDTGYQISVPPEALKVLD